MCARLSRTFVLVRGAPFGSFLTSTSIDGPRLPFCKRDDVIDEAVSRLARLA
jgi:hypothetical protein